VGAEDVDGAGEHDPAYARRRGRRQDPGHHLDVGAVQPVPVLARPRVPGQVHDRVHPGAEPLGEPPVGEVAGHHLRAPDGLRGAQVGQPQLVFCGEFRHEQPGHPAGRAGHQYAHPGHQFVKEPSRRW
jgi:hypothetical protein